MATFHERFYHLYDEARKEKGVGRKEFAARCDVTKGQLNGWLDGKSEPNTSDLKKIAKNLNVSLYWLVGASSIRDSSLEHFEEVYATLPTEHLKILKLFSKFLQEQNKK